jgi:hypothetical protein
VSGSAVSATTAEGSSAGASAFSHIPYFAWHGHDDLVMVTVLAYLGE